jgi:hypothetical protein
VLSVKMFERTTTIELVLGPTLALLGLQFSYDFQANLEYRVPVLPYEELESYSIQQFTMM